MSFFFCALLDESHARHSDDESEASATPSISLQKEATPATPSSAEPEIQSKDSSVPSPHPKQMDAKAKSQRDLLLTRVNNNAKAIIAGRWHIVQKAYKPKEKLSIEHPEWKALPSQQETLNARVNTVKAAKGSEVKETEAKYHAIMATRKEFPTFTKDVPAPQMPASLVPPPPPAAVSAPQQANKGTSQFAASPQVGSKRKAWSMAKLRITIPDDDEDDSEPEPEMPDTEYDPIEDERVQREERAVKRQRNRAAEPATRVRTAAAAAPVDEEDLELQLQEIQMKANLAILQVKRKKAAAKKKLGAQSAGNGNGNAHVKTEE